MLGGGDVEVDIEAQDQRSRCSSRCGGSGHWSKECNGGGGGGYGGGYDNRSGGVG